MAITKSNFINYARCPRFVALAEVKKEKLAADVSYKDYKDGELLEKLEEIVTKMYDETEDGETIDLIDIRNPQLESMMKYYNLVEEEASRIALKRFGGTVIAAEKTKDQKRFEFDRDNLKYLCYVDIYNETEEGINIIEVKASTSGGFQGLGPTEKGVFTSIFEKIDNILYLKEDLNNIDLCEKKYASNRLKLFNKYDKGKYIYDLAIQRYIIEESYRQAGKENELDNFKYYLAVLNSDYIFDGTYEKEKAIYNPDAEGNELIIFIDLTTITKEFQKIIKEESTMIEKYLTDLDASPYKLGKHCGRNATTECKFFQRECGSMIPKENSSLNYMHNGQGFVTEDGTKLKGLELINEGYIKMLDVPEEWIKSDNHHIQRNCLKNDKEHIDKEKIKSGLSSIEYPIYHLDFETFPCPVPRFKGEKAYTQSPFEFSLHIEHEPGKCDREKDNIVFLAKSFNDEREELIKKLIENIDSSKGTMLAQNVSFEQGVLKKLANIFPEYRSKLLKISNIGFDLIWLVKTKNDLYLDLGFDEERAKTINYYNHRLSGSYSIKKTLPVFSDLKYDDLDIQNGTDAIIGYANYPYMSKKEFDKTYNDLIEYCKQDTWAMVEILNKLRQISN